MAGGTRLMRRGLTLCLAALVGACAAGSGSGSRDAAVPASAGLESDADRVAAWISEHEAAPVDALRPVVASWGDGELRLHFTYLTGRDYCGSGGCTLLIHRTAGGRVEALGRLTVVQPPVTVLPTTTNGLPDLAVRIAGGGIEPGTAILTFDGASYPSNPTVPPARRAARAPSGHEVITEAMVWPAPAAP
ncbi:MAG: hypothetical protein H2038_10740 [Brevundimonas sp.]|uniref:hypothetical protein n=1 Tax=Brevundimonas sp. TaxID=1871086 RepID=UPI001821A027|nr:hypothetical protein [Brevundimonas sp.]MBA4805118.1 hypothetical protein [Brevundimonas sp.]